MADGEDGMMATHLCPTPACAATHVAEARRIEAMRYGYDNGIQRSWHTVDNPYDRYQPRHLREEEDVD